MARPRSRLLDLESDDVFYGASQSDHVSVAVHATVAWTILFLVLHLTVGFPHAAAVCAVLYGGWFSFLDSEALFGFLCLAASGVLATGLGFSSGWKVLHTFAGCEQRAGFRASTPPPSVYTSTGRASTVASTPRNSN
ncbi:hypothetical protein QOZ80_2AG0135140 [Eleusine coracana subsp. coracana]|nr:hypothetical protein QOZ80_2AG0135140 [Eleusine coracana subsp. coracana]